MEDDDDFNLEDELERELEAGVDLDEEEDGVLTTAPTAEASAHVPSESQQAATGELPSAADSEPGGPAADVHALEQQREAKLQERQRKRTEVMKLLDEDQLDRYEAFRRSKLSKPNMKKLLHSVTGQVPLDNTTIVMCGIAKMFVGDVVEEAREVAKESGDTGPLTPEYLQRAYQRLDRRGKIPHRARKPRLMRML